MKKIKGLFQGLKIFRSLRFSLFLIILLTGFLASFVMRHALLKSYESRALKVRMADVQNQYNILAYHLFSSGYIYDTSIERINTELKQLSAFFDGRILIIDKSFKVVKDTYGISEGKTIISSEVIKGFSGIASNNYEDRNGFIEMAIPIAPFPTSLGSSTDQVEQTDGSQMVQGVLLSSASTYSIANTMNVMGRSGTVVQAIFMLGLLPVAFFLSYALTRPFSRITRAIQEIKAGFADDKIEVRDYLETEHFSDAFNQLQSRMRAVDESRQEFVSNVSHELKTPITSMKVLADSLISQENVPSEIYREFMGDIGAEIDREAKIIDDLLALVKMDRKDQNLNYTAVDISSLLELILKRMRPIANKAQIEIVLETIRPVTAQVDEVKLTLAVTNLVENAIKYNNEDGWVRVVLDADHQYFEIKVIDNGIGIPEESLEHIYERFYRVDKSHSRAIGGSGLGLAISKRAILMHRGKLEVESKLGEGTTFTVRIPLTKISVAK